MFLDRYIYEYARQKLDVLSAWVGVLLGILAISLSFHFQFNQEHIGFAVLFPSLLYLVLRKKLTESGSNTPNLKCRYSNISASFTIFLILFSISLVLLRSAIYHRPLAYFITITLISAVIAYQILNADKRYVWLVLIEILLVSISIRAGVYYLFHDIYGFDIPYYIALINEIINTGYIPSNYPGAYANFFMMPLTVAVVQQIFGLDMKCAYFSIGIVEALSPIFIFFICKQLFDFKSGLMAALMLALSDHYIMYGFWIIAMSLALPIFSLIVLLAITKVSKSEILSKSLLIVFLFTIIITHAIATTVTFVVVALFFIVASVITLFETIFEIAELPPKEDRIKITSATTMLFFVSFIAYWMNAFPWYGRSFFANIVHSVRCALTSIGWGDVCMVTTVAETPNYASVLLANMGYIILIIFATLGILISLSPANITNKKFALTASVIALMGIVYVPSAFNFTSILPGRWFPFIYILLIIFVPSGIFALTNLMRSTVSKNILVISILSFFVFFMITSPIANPDNELYSNEFRKRVGIYDSEMKAGDFAASKCNTVSKNCMYCIPDLRNATFIDPEEPKTYHGSTILIREYDLKKGFYIPYTRPGFGECEESGEDFIEYLGELNIIYSNGKVEGYR